MEEIPKKKRKTRRGKRKKKLKPNPEATRRLRDRLLKLKANARPQ